MPHRITAIESRHTEEVQNIIGSPPSWLLNWGITLIFGILVFALGSTQLIQYPELVKAKLKIRSLDADSPVDVKASGRLSALLVKDNQVVKKGQAVAVFEKDTGRLILTSPRDGIISYRKIMHEKQTFYAEETLFQIHSLQQAFFGELVIARSAMQKIKAGQEVLIKVNDFPSPEYGTIHGTIMYTANEIAGKNGHLAAVDLKDNNLTDRNNYLHLRDGMDADAEVIVQHTSLLKRLTDNAFKKFIH